MPPLLKIFFTGMLISFLGSLPLGTLNIAAMQISIADGVNAALLFSAGSLLAEIFYVRISLVAMDWIRKQERIFKILEWVTLLIVVALAAASFYAALHPSKEDTNVILDSKLNKFFLGFMMSAVNPVQIPFWFGWSTVLFTKKLLLPRSDHYNTYIIGIGIGTFIGNLIFIFGGRLIADKIKNNQDILNWVIGGIFAITALIQIWKMARNKGAAHQIEHPEEMQEKIEHRLEKFEDNIEKLEDNLEKIEDKVEKMKPGKKKDKG